MIYAAIILMWAAYFIPLLLRRHEELSESRSAERFSRAMRILSRREPTPDQRYVVMPPRPASSFPVPRPRSRLVEPQPSTLQPSTPQPSTQRPSTPRPSAPRPAAGRRPARRATSLAVRRRRILAALLLATVVTLLLAPVTPVPLWPGVALLVLTVADVVHLRVQQRRRTELARTRASVRRRTRSRLRRFDSAERIVAARRSLAHERAAADAARRAAEEAAREAARVDAERRAAEAAGWRPVPVPLPTYVTKPKAPRVGPALDSLIHGLRGHGHGSQEPARAEPADAASAQEPFDQTAPVAGGHQESPSYDERYPVVPGADGSVGDDDLDALIERRRAVND